MVSFPRLDEKVELSEESEDETNWWKCECCCPRKEDDPVIKSRKRRESVKMAQEALLSISEPEGDPTQSVKSKHLALTFVPDFIIEEIFEDSFRSVPYAVTSNVVLFMADVSGFTVLCESYCQKGVSGIEELATVLNGFMSTLSAMLIEGGGDILNFAGDAFLVQWVEEGKYKGIEKAAIKAYECAVALQTHQCLQSKNLDGTLKVKIGIAVGEIQTWVLGSSDFLLFVAAGRTLPLVQKAEEHCVAGDIVVTKEFYQLLVEGKANTYTLTDLESGYKKITNCVAPYSDNEPEPNRKKLFEKCSAKEISMAKIFLIPALRGLKSADELQYVSELTMVTILFIALLNVEIAEPKVLDKSFDIILECVKKNGGVLNKMLLFDKGCTFLVAFGLPGLKHSNDAARGICCAEDIVRRLNEVEIQVSIGVSSGTCFCGIVGHPQRQEYTVIGARVNMAARIMVYYNDQPVALNVDTYHLSRDELGHMNFVELPARKMKGIDSPGAIYAYRRKRLSMTSAQSSFQDSIVEDSDLLGGDVEKEKIRKCLDDMRFEEKRGIQMKARKLLPVIIIKGQNGSGKSYLMFVTVDTAVALNYKIAVCCVISSYFYRPFSVISHLIQRMLNLTMNESCLERENAIMSKLPSSQYSNLYLLNHLFNVDFPVPVNVSANIVPRTEKISQLAKIIIHKFCKGHNTLIAVDNADDMDDQSWYIIHQLAEEEKVVIVLSLSLNFKEDNVSASVLLLKNYLHFNMESLQQDYFAPLLCWFLGVKAVNTRLFVVLKNLTDGKAHLLNEISLSISTLQYIVIVPLESLDPARIEKEFYLEKFSALEDDKSMACDLKPGVNLRDAVIPTNINDAVKESLNNLTIQDRLMLKRAAVLGTDFDVHSLESISSGMKRSEVLQSVSNLLLNHIFSSVCTLENVIVPDSDVSVQSIALDTRSICFCFVVYLRTSLKDMATSEWPIGPYHRLRFRTHAFRSCILANMTKDQLYNMRMDVAHNLESNGLECAACKSRRTEGMDIETDREQQVRKYSMELKKCSCLEKRPKLFSEISILYASIGMLFLPAYFNRKAAQAANDINFPIQAFYYIQVAEKAMPQYWLLEEEEIKHEESYFDPLVLDASLKKTKAISFLLLGDTYNAVSNAFEALELLGMDAVYFHGVFNPREFKKILPKFPLLQAESITKLIGFLAKAYLYNHVYKLAQDLLRIEYIALQLYPIDFIQVLNQMAGMFKLKYFLNDREKLQELQSNIFKLCHSKLRNLDVLLDLTEINTIGNVYAVIIEANLSLGQLKKSENIAIEAVKILQLINETLTLTKIRIYLFCIHYCTKDYVSCLEVITELGKMDATTSNRQYHALYTCSLSMLLRKREDGIAKTEIFLLRDKCNAFATQWKRKFVEVMPKDLAFYISVCLAYWCLYSDKKTSWIAGMSVFKECYEIAITLHSDINKKNHNFWTVSATISLLKLQVKCLKEEVINVSADDNTIREVLNGLKHKIQNNYPVYMEAYKKLLDDVQVKK